MNRLSRYVPLLLARLKRLMPSPSYYGMWSFARGVLLEGWDLAHSRVACH